MRKKYIMWILTICMVASMSSTAVAFAETTGSGVTQAETTQAAIKLEKISLSLEDVYKQLENSKTMELIKLQKQSDESVAKGYSETSSSLRQMEKSDAIIAGFDTSNKKVVEKRRDFANSMLAANNEARVNGLKQDAFQKYYTLKNTETQVQIANEGLTLKKNFLETTKRKYQVGMASKSEVDNAENEVKSAEAQLEALKNSLQQLKSNFNSYLGYDISQEVVLTDVIQEIVLPKTNLSDAIASALKNRNEMKEASYMVELSQLNFNSYKAYPSSSSKYISAKTQLLNAEIAKQNKPTDMELDVRKKYDSMMDSYNAVQTGKKTLKSAEDTLNTATRKYNLGMVTITDVQQAQLGLNSAKLSQANALLNYNLSVENYNLSMGVGTSPANL
ncbi:TolC family protein [Aminipila terrae]|uniref:TolC family protein n=1 Tax=Aminipila terrae TaxID=2697030 RepID=A0A6P1MCR5_9FIRM|nr:TolC family protein [Aminipila terrae]QHI72499.1 TolC family protein [Aminipila terrae]